MVKEGRGEGRCQAITGIELSSVRLLNAEERQAHGDFAVAMLDRHLDLVRGLRALPPGVSLELRYLRTADEPHRVRVCLFLRAAADRESKAAVAADRAGRFVFDLLTVNNPLQVFSPIARTAELETLLNPFPIEDIVEITRREEHIPVDPARGEDAASVGFVQEGPSPHHSESTSPLVYYVYPYCLSFETMERLCNTLLLGSAPALVSICLRLCSLEPDDLRGLEERVRMCEKFSQLSLSGGGDLDRLQPFLRRRAEALLKNCSRELLQLQDAAFEVAVRVASAGSVPDALLAVTGASLTEHAGHPRPAFPDALEDPLTGGYEATRAIAATQRETARHNLRTGGFEPWVPTQARGAEARWRGMFPVSQVCAAFRLPLPLHSEFPGIETLLHRPKPAPSELPADGVLLGEHLALGRVRPVRCPTDDRRRHTYVVGQTGTGKSTLFLGMILQDMREGRGVGVIDPHGELIEQVLASIPKEREADVIYLDPTDVARPVGINMLDARTPIEKDFCVNYLIDVFDLLYVLKDTGGPMFEMYMRNALQLLLDQPEGFRPAVVDVPPLFQRRAFRKRLIDTCTNPYAVDFWTKEADEAGGDLRLQNVAPYITSKLTRFIYNEVMRGIVGQRETTIDFRQVIDKGKILLVDLRKGILGDINSHFLGMMVVGKIFGAALGRTGATPQGGHRDFFLYVDEFQNLATKTFVSILSEARKYRLSVVLTNQYIAQLPDYIVQGILGNVGTLVSLRVGTQDADVLTRAFGGVVSPGDLQGLPNWHAYVRLLAGGNVSAPFDMATILPEPEKRRVPVQRIKKASRKAYGRPRRTVEREIRGAWE
jgi:hypothetical protein